MIETAIHPSPAVLGGLSTFHELPTDELKALCQKLRIYEAKRGEVLLSLGAEDDCTLYLLEGGCRLKAEDGGVRVIRHVDPSAKAPLARLRPSRYRVVADTDVRYLWVKNSLLQGAVAALEQSSALSLDNYQVEEEEDLGHLGAENRLTVQIIEDLNADRLLLPSLPQVALQIGEAVNDDKADARSVAALIETDPAIALKIVKAANSARYGGVSQVRNVTEAVARLGLYDTRILVVAFAMRELFRTPSKALEQRMVELWEHSRRIAALASVLSGRVDGFNQHEALLAGLVHDIGVLAVIGYARDFPEIADDPFALTSSVGSLRTQLGGMILSRWQLPPALINAANEAENWYRRHPGSADYADLVIVAQVHEGIAGDIDPAKVPALALLGLTAGELAAELGELNQAVDEVATARQLLAG